jgi:hypothetical protein
MEFLFMLTQNDLTVPDANEVYSQVRHLDGLRYVGFKDVGVPAAELQTLTDRIHADGKTVTLEVVSESVEAEVRAVEVGLEIGVDWVLGGTHPDEVAPLLTGTDIVYCPFPGRIVGHPSNLRGTIEEIVEDARLLAARPEIGGLDLLAYRYDGDVLTLVEQVVAAVDVPVITAGSIRTPEQIRDMQRLGAWGFTIGAAVFDRELPTPDTSLAGQVAYVLELLESLEPLES